MLEVGVKALIRNTEGLYLFLQRKDPLPDGTGIRWDIPGGRIHEQESLDVALAREISEETSLKVTASPKLLTAQDIFIPGKNQHIVRLTYLIQANGSVRLSDEHQAYQWASLTEGRALHIDAYLDAALAELV
jgi:8-oxo-dGTP diphosphatase